MSINERAVDSSGDSSGVFRENLGMSGIRSIKKYDSILATRGAFASNYADLAVGSDADVINQARINLHRVGQFRVRRIADVIDEHLVGDRRHIGVVAPDPLLSCHEILDRASSHDLNLALHIS